MAIFVVCDCPACVCACVRACLVIPSCLTRSPAPGTMPDDEDLEDETPERTGLLLQIPPQRREDPGSDGGQPEQSALSLLFDIFQIAVPTALGNLSEFLPITFAMGMVGRFNVGGAGIELDALAMANSYWNMTGLAVQYGLNSAMRTLCPQAVGSGRSRELSGIHVQRGVIIALAAQIPSILLALYADRVLIWMHQPADLAALAQQYALLVQPALCGIALMSILQRVLQAEGHILANFYISFAIFLVAPCIQYLLIVHMKLGLRGAGIAFSIYNCLYLALMVPYMLSADLGHIFIPRREALSCSGMYSHLSLAVPGLLCQLLEWASMEMVSIIAGTRPSARRLIGALGLCLNLEAIFCMFSVGFMVAVSIKVGHAVGAGDAAAAKRVAVFGILSALGWSLLIAVALFAFRTQVVGMFTNDESIASTASSLFGPLGLLITMQAVNCVMQGVLTGAGLQRYTAGCNLVGWYVVAAPVSGGLIWGLRLDLEAGYVLLLSCSSAMLTSFLGQALLLSRRDWAQIIQESDARLEEQLANMNMSGFDVTADEEASVTASEKASYAGRGSFAVGPRGPVLLSRPRSISLAQSFRSGISGQTGYSRLSSHMSDYHSALGSSPFMLSSPHPMSLTFVVPAQRRASPPTTPLVLDSPSSSTLTGHFDRATSG